MKFRCIVLIMSCIMIQTVLWARQSGRIIGVVTDAKTKQVLFGTNVLIEGSGLGAATDETGTYRIDNVPVGVYQLRFGYIGYRSVTKTDVVVKSAAPAYVNVELTPEIVEGQAITVTAGYFQARQTVEPSVVSLSREEIRRFPGGFEDVVRTVSTLPGVAINMAGGRNDLLVRGGGPSENLYLINNIEVPNINHFGTPGNTGGSLSFVNLDFVDQVMFSTGGFGAQYGDKLSSVLALTMVKRKPKQIETKGTLSATQFGIDTEIPLGRKGGLVFSARKSYLDLIFKAAGLPFVPVYTDYNVIVNYDLSKKDRLFFIGLSAINNVDRNLDSEENRVFNASLLDNTQYKGITGLNYRRLLPRGYMDVTFSVNLSRYRLKQLDAFQNTYFKSDADEWETAGKVQLFQSFGKQMGLLGGLSLKQIRNDNVTQFADTIYDRSGNRVPVSQLGISPNTAVNTSAQKRAGFVMLEWTPCNQWTLSPGLRLDYFDFINSPFYLAPRFSMQYRYNPAINFKASAGIYYQAPSYVWIVNPANRDLKALQNRMFVLGCDFLIREDIRFSVEGYFKTYKDLPTGTIPGVNDYIVITNTGTSYGGREDDFQSFGFFGLVSGGTGESRGVELSVQKKYSDIPLYGLLSLAFNESEVTAYNGKVYPGQYDQRFILNLSGGYIFNDKWEIAAKFRYFTGTPYTPVYRPSENGVNPGNIQNLPEEYLSARLEPGHHLDIRVDRYFNFPGATLITYIDIQNVYNYKIAMKPGYDFWNDKIEKYGSIGILPSIGISLEI